MTKKQLGIICTLLALIVCTALLAAKLNNGGLNDPSDLSAALITDNTNNSDSFSSSSDDKNSSEKKSDDKNSSNSATETVSQRDFFYNARSEREQREASAIQQLKSISESKSATQEQKANATSELQKLTLRQEKEKAVESNVKNKGYDDCLCEISQDQTKASIVVQSASGLDEKAGAEIQEIVQNASNIKEVTIEVKK